MAAGITDIRQTMPGWQDPLEGKPLTDRQMAIVKLCQDGLDYEEIGRELYCSSRTVKHMMEYISRKVGQGSRYNRMRIVVALMRQGVLT